jgi:hypothetical protein
MQRKPHHNGGEHFFEEPGPMNKQPPRTSEFTINGDEVVAKVKELIHEGNVRRIIIKNDDGRTMLEVPLTIGIIGAALMPVLAAIGAAAALATRCTIVVEREGDPVPSANGTPSAGETAGYVTPSETDAAR